ncbi:hypothetical protein AV530_006178 [Patagioenas fasciata monilis]|uniref:Uncharacterized protein n=1 Tax=Patagioenas fasciata monilis TaxID=372326 RepID=A0A1V4J8G7_PATFA|nr:hypothetical protein AV530_006178 [Patagioenas fasciata monilis]
MARILVSGVALFVKGAQQHLGKKHFHVSNTFWSGVASGNSGLVLYSIPHPGSIWISELPLPNLKNQHQRELLHRP